jgi:hypothetical protein
VENEDGARTDAENTDDGVSDGDDDAHLIPLPEGPRPKGSFYSPDAVGIAAFLGSPVAGSVVLALNYRVQGKNNAAIGAVVGGLAGTLGLVALATQMTSGAGLLGIAIAFGMRAIAQSAQGEQFKAHTLAGGRPGSSWAAAGIGAVPGALFVFLYIQYGMGPDLPEKRVSFGQGQNIHYEDPVTKRQVKRLGKALADAGYFGNTGRKDVMLAKQGRNYVVSFVVKPGAATDETTREQFRDFGGTLSTYAFDGTPVVVRLLDQETKELARLAPISGAESGDDLRTSCEAGSADACSDLATAHRTGTGVERNETLAAELYEKSCDGGSAVGCYNLAMAYRTGTGVARDEDRAMQLFERACEAGSQIACQNAAQ